MFSNDKEENQKLAARSDELLANEKELKKELEDLNALDNKYSETETRIAAINVELYDIQIEREVIINTIYSQMRKKIYLACGTFLLVGFIIVMYI